MTRAQSRWLYGFSHVPISDDPELVAGLMLDFLDALRKGAPSENRVQHRSDVNPHRRRRRTGRPDGTLCRSCE
jgi:hypothetical protein